MSGLNVTPGFWEPVQGRGQEWDIITDDGSDVLATFFNDNGDAEPNAKLAAAGPKLYMALNLMCAFEDEAVRASGTTFEANLRWYIDRAGQWNDYLAMAKQALACARGEEDDYLAQLRGGPF